MLAATSTMWDVLSWGGETQALIYDPAHAQDRCDQWSRCRADGATPEYFRNEGLKYPPAYGPLAAVTPGTPGGLLLMLAEFGTLSLADVLAPAIELADGYPIEAETANSIELNKDKLEQWPYSRTTCCRIVGSRARHRSPARSFVNPISPRRCASWSRPKPSRSRAGKSRQEAIRAAHERFYRGDIAEEFVRGVQEQGGLITREDLANWKPRIEEPVTTSYRGIDVYKLDVWTQGPALLQSLNLLEGYDLRALGYNSAPYIHLLYQAMNLAFADRDFYYATPIFRPDERDRDCCRRTTHDSARRRSVSIATMHSAGPGDPYPFQGARIRSGSCSTRPARQRTAALAATGTLSASDLEAFRQGFTRGTTSVIAADANGWLVSMTPSGGWIPAVIAGRTGIGMSQRMQAFVLDPAENPSMSSRPANGRASR
jgi:gamma-glutamyltranspeptidase/glutathione hydrolase